MKLAVTVNVQGSPIRFSGWRTGFSPGSPVQTFEVTPLEPAVTYMPSEILTPNPVEIVVAVEGTNTYALKNGHVDGVQDGITDKGHTNRISGRDDAFKLLEQGPRRDTVFVPRGIVEEHYPRGVKIRTLAVKMVLPGPVPGVVRRRGSCLRLNLYVNSAAYTDYPQPISAFFS